MEIRNTSVGKAPYGLADSGRFPLTLPANHGIYDTVTAGHNRELLARLDREQERHEGEDQWMRPHEGEQAFAARSRREFQGIIPGDSILALMPASADPLSPSDPSRRQEFARRLTEIAVQAIRLPAPSPAVETTRSGALVQSICAGCRGSCCRSGGDHAFLTEETIARVLQAHPDWTLAQVLETYLAHLPAESIVDSCLYHSATGCGLPRELRSETCDRHLCGKLQHLLAGLPETPLPAILAVFFDRGTWARTALIDESGCRILSDSGQE